MYVSHANYRALVDLKLSKLSQAPGTQFVGHHLNMSYVLISQNDHKRVIERDDHMNNLFFSLRAKISEELYGY